MTADRFEAPNAYGVAGHFFGDRELTLHENRRGHINGTYVVECGTERYILQKINRGVFKHPDEVMANIAAVTSHISRKLLAEGADEENGVLHFLDSDTGKNFFIDADGEYWRAYRFVEGDCRDSCDSVGTFTRVGRAFGRFQSQLADFDASSLYETIKDFHNTKKRYLDLEAAAKADAVGRADSVERELSFARVRSDDYAYIAVGIAGGAFPLRVTHNDTKLNNIILDPATGEGRCVIDLDTVMPGSLLYDFGDAVRYGASSAPEDERDLGKVFVVPEMFAAFAEGFASALGDSISENEILAFPMAARLITLETGMRFLTDYLSGDTYFRIDYPEHNLDRARNQFRLAESMEESDLLDTVYRLCTKR